MSPPRAATVAFALLAVGIIGAGCGMSSGDGGAHAMPSSHPAPAPPTAWSAFALPAEFKDRQSTVYAQIDDTHALAYGGELPGIDKVEHNDGVLVDLVTGTVTDLPGPKVRGALARASAATEAGSNDVAVAGLQCVSPSEDPKYVGENSPLDGCSPGPLTIAIYEGANRAWSRPKEAPFDYGQAFAPTIIGFVDGRVYIEVSVYDPSPHDDYVSFEVSTGRWARIAPPPGPVSACLGESRVVGLVYDVHSDSGQTSYSNPSVVTYDPIKDTWSTHPVPKMSRSEYPYGRSCTEHWVVINDNRPAQPNLYYAFSLVDGNWTELSAPPVNQLLGALQASAGDTLVTWNTVNVPSVDDATPASITIGADAKWTARVPTPVTEDGSADADFQPHAHAGTRIVSFYKGTALTADLSKLADRAEAKTHS